jgi:hypothetical protein
LHSCIVLLFDQLKEKYCTSGLENISTRFFQEAFISKCTAMVHGVACKSGHGLPNVI